MMFFTNQNMTNGIGETKIAVRYSVVDSETYFQKINYQISHSVHDGFKLLNDKIKRELHGECDS